MTHRKITLQEGGSGAGAAQAGPSPTGLGATDRGGMAAMLRRAFERAFPGANKPQIKPNSDEELEKAFDEGLEKIPYDEKGKATAESEFFDKLIEEEDKRRQERQE